jgi:hypothetical protein
MQAPGMYKTRKGKTKIKDLSKCCSAIFQEAELKIGGEHILLVARQNQTQSVVLTFELKPFGPN